MLRHYGDASALRGKTVALWGLAFKPNTDDMRAASSRRLPQQLWDAGAKVRDFDPEAMQDTRRIFGERSALVLCESAEETLRDADALAVQPERKQLRRPYFDELKHKLADAAVLDGRNLSKRDENRQPS